MFVAYSASLVLSAIYHGLAGEPGPFLPIVGFGVLSGTMFLVALLLFIHNSGQRGLAICSAITSTSALIPAGLSIALGDHPTVIQSTGILVAGAAMPLLSLATVTGKAIHERPNGWLALAFFLAQGGAISGNLLAFKFLPEGSRPLYLMVVFVWAGFLALIICLVKRREFLRGDLGRGIALAFSNTFSVIAILVGLNYVVGFIFFPVGFVLVLATNTAIARLVWHERIKPWGWVGLGLAGIATVLLNIK